MNPVVLGLLWWVGVSFGATCLLAAAITVAQHFPSASARGRMSAGTFGSLASTLPGASERTTSPNP